ncbi:MAG: hypothetical protein IKD35_03620 [Clostridia bacterium]|nr:hypothetical protein [Clostridia bacterium]
MLGCKQYAYGYNYEQFRGLETFFKKPEDIDIKPIEDKVFQDGIKEILGKEYD